MAYTHFMHISTYTDLRYVQFVEPLKFCPNKIFGITVLTCGPWHSIVWRTGSDILEEPAATIIYPDDGGMVPEQCWYPSTKLHGVTSRKRSSL